jgi:hypothetical protein
MIGPLASTRETVTVPRTIAVDFWIMSSSESCWSVAPARGNNPQAKTNPLDTQNRTVPLQAS